MASRSSRRRSASRSNDIADFLRTGTTLQKPSAEQLRVAEELESQGLVRTTVRTYVRCADPEDRDFPPRDRSCPGRVLVEEDLDEDGNDLRCSECGRVVRPTRFKKRRHTELRTHVLQDGVVGLVRSELAKLNKDVRDVAGGVLRVDVGATGVYVCILDYCAEGDQRRGRDWAKTNPTCYVTVNSRHAADRFLPDGWLTKVALADVVAGDADLADELNRLADAGPPRGVTEVSIPVYAKTVPSIRAGSAGTPRPERRFVVEVGERAIRIQGADVVARQARQQVRVFRILWQQFLDDLRDDTAPDEFVALKLRDIARALDRENEADSDAEATDPESVRRVINNLQTGIEKAVKRKLGEPIDREDIVETRAWSSTEDTDFGYRINPLTVCARPFQEPPRLRTV